jgi:hypothetical protein
VRGNSEEKTVTIYLSFLALVCGLLMFKFCEPKYPKAVRVGEILFFVGALAFLLQYGGWHIPIGTK